MKREAKLLLQKATESLGLAIEIFNRPHDDGRIHAHLILLDHSFEMLLKAAIVHRGGAIREKRAKETIGFDACVRRALSNGDVKFLTKEQALTLQVINGLRDAAQHFLLRISEAQLYIHAQSGVTLFRDILRRVFDQDLSQYLPRRVLPLSTEAPSDVVTLFEQEAKEIRKLLGPGTRKRIEARARLRPLAILDAAIRGDKGQPSTGQLNKLGRSLLAGKSWTDVFPSAAGVNVTTTGSGPTLSLRITKKEGVPVELVPEGTPDAAVVGVKRVDELGFYEFGRDDIAKQVSLTPPKTSAAIWHLKLKDDTKFFKRFRVGGMHHERFSRHAASAIKELLKKEDIATIWEKYKSRDS